MENLKPILAHKYWIIFGLALLVPLVGWFLGTGSAKAAIDERVTYLEGVSVQSGANAPNQQWSEAIEKVNVAERQRLQAAADFLWLKQKNLMLWPINIQSEMANVPYRGKIPLTAKELYPHEYESEYQRILNIVKPFDLETGQGLVDVQTGALERLPAGYWQSVGQGVAAPDDHMWDAQEDMWLMRSLMRGLAAVNQINDAKSITDAPVRRIIRVTLHGGTRQQPGDPAAADGAGTGEMDGMQDYMASSGRGGGMGALGGLAQDGMGGGNPSAKVSFDPAEEFGPNTVQAAQSGEDGAAMDSATTPDAAGGPMGMGYGNTGQAGQQRKRYIDNSEELPFKTRGFYMELVIDHTRLPELLAELSSLDWPVQIIRVQQGEFGAASSSGGGSSNNMNPMMAFGGGGGFLPGALPAAGNQPFRPPAFGGNRGARFPMGANPMGLNPMGRAPMGVAAGAGQNPADAAKLRAAQDTLDRAMSDPSLALVAIAGEMTLFRPPDFSGQQDDGLTPETTVTPSADPALATAPAGAVVQEAAPPAEGAPANPTAPAAAGAQTPPADPAAAPAATDTPPSDAPAAESPPTTPEAPAAPAEGAPPSVSPGPGPAASSPDTGAAPAAGN
ncbi:MAG: hypothetical protein KY476_12350 [Planctomycetes bacterium]|nr:hypothetical protein [Planctomycetota bacterium]